MKTLLEHQEEAKPILSELHKLGYWFITGSSWFNGQGNDLDVVILVQNLDAPSAQGFELTSKSEYGEDGMACFRKCNVNLIAVENAIIAEDWELARDLCTRIAKRQGGTINKADRCFIHKLIVDLLPVAASYNMTKDLT